MSGTARAVGGTVALLLLCERIWLDFVEVMRAKVAKNAERYPAEAAWGRAERQ
jgi:hypothetical protein